MVYIAYENGEVISWRWDAMQRSVAFVPSADDMVAGKVPTPTGPWITLELPLAALVNDY